MSNEENKSFVDLHVHTTYSDGLLSPQEVVQKAIELQLKAIAITDHDCIEGIAPSIEAASGTGLEIIPGVEISAAKEETEIHLLGYFIDWREKNLVGLFQKMRENRIIRMRMILALLHENGLEIDDEKVLAAAPDGTLGRMHLARIMLDQNLVRSTNEAFDRYIGDGKPCHVRHKRLDYREAIEVIRNAGGVPVLAHPGAMGKDEYIPSYIEAGLRGIEVYHSEHKQAANQKYFELAGSYGLVVSGGSDCHGSKWGPILLGTTKVDYSVVDELRREAEKIRHEKNT